MIHRSPRVSRCWLPGLGLVPRRWMSKSTRPRAASRSTDRLGVVARSTVSMPMSACGRPSGSARWRPTDAARSRPVRHGAFRQRATRQPADAVLERHMRDALLVLAARVMGRAFWAIRASLVGARDRQVWRGPERDSRVPRPAGERRRTPILGRRLRSDRHGPMGLRRTGWSRCRRLSTVGSPSGHRVDRRSPRSRSGA